MHRNTETAQDPNLPATAADWTAAASSYRSPAQDTGGRRSDTTTAQTPKTVAIDKPAKHEPANTYADLDLTQLLIKERVYAMANVLAIFSRAMRPERELSLDMMRDTRIGVFGAAALVMALAIKGATLTAMPASAAACTLVAAHCLSRLSAVLARTSSQPARTDGLAAERAAPMEGLDLAVAIGTGVAVIAICAFWTPFFALITGLTGLALGHAAILVMAERRLGGYTGDTLGSVQQKGELGFMLGVAAWL